MDWLKRLSLALAALAMTASGSSGPAAASLSRESLATINGYIEARDDRGLREFLATNPELLDNSPLGQILAEYVASPRPNEVFTALGWTSRVPSRVREAMDRAKRDPSLY